MTAYTFFKWFAFWSEISVLIPVLMALSQWRRLDIRLKLILGFLSAELILYLTQDVFYFVYSSNNLFLNYLFTLVFHTLLCFFFMKVLESKNEKRVVVLLLVLGYVLLGYDFETFTNKSLNFTSGLSLNILFFTLSVYSLVRYSLKTSVTLLYIQIGLSLHFLLRSFNYWTNDVLLQSQSYTVLWLNEEIIFYYLMLLVFALFTYAFYSHRYEKE